MGLFSGDYARLHKHRSQKSKRDPKSVFSGADPACGRRAFWPGGFRYWPGGDGGVDAFVWDPSTCDRAFAAGTDCARGADGAGRWAVDLGAERSVPRRSRGDAVRRAVLDARVTRGVSELARAGALALALRAESYGGSHRRIPLGADRTRAAPGHCHGRIRRWGGSGSDRRTLLLPKNGIEHRRPRLKHI